ncbi:NAD(P)/FAD-dependent oxidoreductase [Halobacillus sp. Marseille-Q1614]|uniref:NAD(P)/FAD-dependent oxidoreductase n=1 Tax=Halobacillus sp. Marseille-Q1614 TaxID=2709134 RepID=UPI0015707F83|nr:NAD(P)/FAD-dependent oxidoreductase [Halobacillus sp. Marseille-Q1614]
MEQQADVIIIGARVAGASLAILLGKMGKKVTLVDKAHFPSDTLSTHHLSHLEYLKKLEVLKEVEATGLRKITRMRTYIKDSFIEGPRSSYTLIPKRAHLDQVLIKKALSFPSVELLEGTQAVHLLKSDGRVNGIVIVDSHGNKQYLKAPLVVGADGKNSKIAHLAGAKKYGDHSPIRPVFYGYYKNITPLLEPTTEIFLNDGRIGFLFPMEQGRDCLGLEVWPEEFQQLAKNQGKFEEIYRTYYGMEKRMKEASLQGEIIGTPGVPNFFRQAAGKGWALIGDAGHSKDPSTGLGMNDAFMQAFLLAEAIKSNDNGLPWEDAAKIFQEKRDQGLAPSYRLTLDYIQSRRSWTANEEALFQAMAANPTVWNKIVPSLPGLLKDHSTDIPELYGSVEYEAKNFELKEEK